MEKEFFECVETAKTEEYQRFPAERYRVGEIESGPEETCSVPETASSEVSSAAEDPVGPSLGDAEKIMRSSSVPTSATATSSASAAAGASVSAGTAGGVLTGVAAVCAAAVVGIVSLPGITQTQSVPEPIDPGTLKYLNYQIDYHPDEGSGSIFSDITLYFEGALADGFTCEVCDALTGKTVVVQKNKATFTDVERGEREMLLTVYGGEEVVETQTVSVEDHYLYDESLCPDFAYKVTYNSDGTCNLYAYCALTEEEDSAPAYDDGVFATLIRLYDFSDVAFDGYETVVDGALGYVLNVKEESFKAEFVSYFVKEGNYYSLFSSEKIVVEDVGLYWVAEVRDSLLTLIVADELDGDVEIKVTHDDASCEEFVLSAQELNGGFCELPLSKISRNPLVEISGKFAVYRYDPSERITRFIGEEFRSFSESVRVESILSSTVSLTRCEIFNTSYNPDSGDVLHLPVYLYFDGFLNEGDTFSVRVFNSDGTEVSSRTDLVLSDKPVIFNELSVDGEYTFAFYVKSDGEESPAGEITRTLSVYEFSDLPSWFCLTPNPGDALVTYNGDGTSNVYLYMNVQETDYDMYYKVYLVDTAYSDGSVFLEYSGKEDVAVFRNVPAGQYGIRVGVLINENGTCYAAYDMGWPSGTIPAGTDENGYYPESRGETYYDSSTGEFYVGVPGKFVGDLLVRITPEGGQPIEITVHASETDAEYGYSTFTIDLSGYGLTSFTVTVEGSAVFQYGNGDVIGSKVTVAGDASCPFKIESVF